MSKRIRRAEHIRQDLEQRGVASGLSLPLAEQLEGLTSGLPPDAYDALLRGIVLATRTRQIDASPQPRAVHDEASPGSGGEQLRTAPEPLREVERLMGAFGTELKKLEESLETLAAYVTRLRTVSGSGGNVLH
jgi:hypothetical protein